MNKFFMFNENFSKYKFNEAKILLNNNSVE